MADDLTPAEAFGALADERRVEILRALDATAGRASTFSALRTRVDVSDSGQFNYHLSRLQLHFVERDDDGYRLTAVGRQVVRAVAAGRFTADARIEAFEHDSRCHCCGATLRVSYRDERLRFRCPDCDREVLNADFPSSGVRERSPAEVVDAFARFSYHRVSRAREGVCPDCSGPVVGRVTEDVSPTIDKPAVVVFTCGVCDGAVWTSFGGLVTCDSRVRSLHRDRGVDLDDGYYWKLARCLSGEFTTVTSTDPWRSTVAFPPDDEVCRTRFEGSDLVAVEPSD